MNSMFRHVKMQISEQKKIFSLLKMMLYESWTLGKQISNKVVKYLKAKAVVPGWSDLFKTTSTN